ncbi:MAG: hypothetical protein JST00_12000 [Deltaproteobacteria bacterium]|nr:hypothetical protein [Deltaproteobacteria bacterium]
MLILVVGRHPEIMARVRALLEGAGFRTVSALTDDEAIRQMREASPGALLLGGGVEETSRAQLAETFRAALPGRIVITHFGGPHGLVEHVRAAIASA